MLWNQVAGFRMSAKGRGKKKHLVNAVDKPKGYPKRGSDIVPPRPPSAPSMSFFNSIVSGRALWISLVLIAASIFIYAPARNHDFLVTWDDPEYVSENLHVAAGLTWEGVRWAFTTGQTANWLPLTWLSYMLGTQLFGLNAGAQLLANLLLHILNTLLLFGLLHKMTGALGRSALVAALFATHPLHVESVAWVSERKDVLSTLIGLITLWTYVDYTQRPGRIRYLKVFLLFALGLTAKPMLVTLPFVMLLLDYWPLGRVALATGAQEGAAFASPHQRYTMMQLVREKLPLLALTVISSIITFLVQQRAGTVSGLTTLPVNLRVANALVSYAAYIGKMLWPVHLSALYPLYRWAPEAVLGSSMALVGITAAVIWEARRHPYLPVGWLWYLGTLVPVIGLVQAGYQSMADRYTYVPLIGLFIILAWGIPNLIPRRSFREFILPAAAGIVILGCAITARVQVEYWKDSVTLWAHALEVTSDNDIAHVLLGDALARLGRTHEAMAHYSEALRIKPDNPEAHSGMGLALANQGRWGEAGAEYSEALRIKPDDADAHNGLGLTLANQGRWGEAMAQYSEAIRLKPTFLDPYCNLGLALAGQGRVEEAISQYSKALSMNPEFVNAHKDLGLALANQGKTAEAIFQFSEVLRLRPDDPEGHNNLGILLANQGRIDEAVTHFLAAVRLKPDFAIARKNLEIALSQQKAGARPIH